MKNIIKNSAPTHIVRHAGLDLQKKTKETLGSYVERVKLPGEVSGPKNDLWQRGTYRTGDGDSTQQVPRAGSLVASKLPSRGHQT